MIGSLTTSLISHWKLDELSGDAQDSHGANHLTDNATVGAATGIIYGARDFELANSEFFRRPNNSSLETGDIDFTLTCWVNFESISAGAVANRIISKFGNAAAVNEFAISLDNTLAKFQFVVVQSDSVLKFVQADTFGTASTATWYFVACWYDKTADTCNISINNGSTDSTASVTGPAATAAGFNIGCLFSVIDTSPIQFMDGLIDEVSYWKRLLTAAERTALYNGGVGLAYPFAPRQGYFATQQAARVAAYH